MDESKGKDRVKARGKARAKKPLPTPSAMMVKALLHDIAGLSVQRLAEAKFTTTGTGTGKDGADHE